MSRSRPEPLNAGPVGLEGGGPLVAVVGALAEELAVLRSRSEIRRSFHWAGCRIDLARLGKTPLILAHTGEGRIRASSGMASILEGFPVGRVIIVGVSGGLSPELPPGGLMVADRVMDGEVCAPAPDQGWSHRAVDVARVRRGTVVTTSRVLCGPDDKRAAWNACGGSGPAAVDLESAAYARAASARGVPYLVVRAISDAAWERLPLDFNLCRRADGRIDRWAVALHAVKHPSTIRGLLRLKRRVAECAAHLADCVEEIVKPGSGAGV